LAVISTSVPMANMCAALTRPAIALTGKGLISAGLGVKDQLAMRELSATTSGEWGSVWRFLAIGAGAGLFLGVVGPFGTYESLYLGWRLFYWVSLMLCGTLFFPVAYLTARHHCLPRGISHFIYIPLVAVLGAVPMTLVVIGVTSAMFSETMGFRFDNYLRVVAISLPMVLLHHLFVEWRKPPAAPLPAPAQQAPAQEALAPPAPVLPPQLLRRLPGRLGTEILCLQMEDHYVRIHTSLGQEMLLLRMRDAIAELDGLEGLQVHRSWWVARRAVASAMRDGKSLTLTLTNKLDVPVARDRLAEVKSAGWLKD
jgi:hypothetical protein